VERHHSSCGIRHRELREMHGGGGRQMPERTHDHPPHYSEFPFGTSESAKGGVKRVLRRKATFQVQERTVADLQVPDSVTPCVLSQFVGNALQSVRVLHYRERHLESLQVVLEMPRVVHVHVSRELARIVTRHRYSILRRELEHGRGPQGAVQMTVQLRLRK